MCKVFSPYTAMNLKRSQGLWFITYEYSNEIFSVELNLERIVEFEENELNWESYAIKVIKKNYWLTFEVILRVSRRKQTSIEKKFFFSFENGLWHIKRSA